MRNLLFISIFICFVFISSTNIAHNGDTNNKKENVEDKNKKFDDEKSQIIASLRNELDENEKCKKIHNFGKIYGESAIPE